jgi:hypothetical protein
MALVAAAFCSCATAQIQPPSDEIDASSERVEVAQGEYKVPSESGIGPSTPAVYSFDEAWTLWRLPDGSFEAAGTRSYSSPSFEFHSNRFEVLLSRELQVKEITEYRKLHYRRDSGPLHCQFLPGKIECDSNAKDSTQNVKLRLGLKEPFGFLWPVSPFSLAAIGETASRDLKIATAVEMVSVEETSKNSPVSATVWSGHLKYLGHEELTLADRRWNAEKFELKLPVHPPFLVWISHEGLLLAFGLANSTKTVSNDTLQLVRFQQSRPF